MHGVTKAVTFSASAERLGSQIDVLADINVPFSEWNISNPSIGGFVTTANNGTLEVLLHLTQSAGNPASTSSGSAPPKGVVRHRPYRAPRFRRSPCPRARQARLRCPRHRGIIPVP